MIQLFYRLLSIPLREGVRQGGTISPTLFIAELQWVIKSLKWDERGVYVNGRFLSNLRFVDDIELLPRSTTEAELMLKELNEKGGDFSREQIGRRPSL